MILTVMILLTLGIIVLGMGIALFQNRGDVMAQTLGILLIGSSLLAMFWIVYRQVTTQ